MHTNSVPGKVRANAWRHNLLLLLLALVLGLVVACGDDEEPTPEVAPAAATTAPTEAPTATVSPLAAPESPLGAPESPLSVPEQSDSTAPTTTITTTTTTTTTAAPAIAPEDAVEMQPVTEVEIEGLTLEKGKSAVRGRLFSKPHDGPLVEAVVRLAEVYCPADMPEGANKREYCVWALDDAFSPSTFSDADGNFVFENIEARAYVLVVGDMMTRYVMLKDIENKPLMWEAPTDKAIDIGEYQVNY